MKRMAVLLCLAMILLLVGCGSATSAPLVIGGVPLSEGVYAYALDQVLTTPEAFDADGQDEESCRAAALRLCRRYAAGEVQLQQSGLSLSVPFKSAAAARTEGLWQFFGAYYRSLGIQKPDITALTRFDANQEQLVHARFGNGGEEAVAVKTLKAAFEENYIAFKAFEGNLYTTDGVGTRTPLSANAAAALEAEFDTMKKRAANGTSIDSLYETYCKNQGLVVTETPEVTLMKNGDPMLPDGFFEEVRALSNGEVGVIRGKNSLFLLQRIDINGDDTYFEAHRDDVLLSLKLPQVEAELDEAAAALDAQIDSRTLQNVFARVRAAHLKDQNEIS